MYLCCKYCSTIYLEQNNAGLSLCPRIPPRRNFPLIFQSLVPGILWLNYIHSKNFITDPESSLKGSTPTKRTIYFVLSVNNRHRITNTFMVKAVSSFQVILGSFGGWGFRSSEDCEDCLDNDSAGNMGFTATG